MSSSHFTEYSDWGKSRGQSVCGMLDTVLSPSPGTAPGPGTGPGSGGCVPLVYEDGLLCPFMYKKSTSNPELLQLSVNPRSHSNHE